MRIQERVHVGKEKIDWVGVVHIPGYFVYIIGLGTTLLFGVSFFCVLKNKLSEGKNEM